MGKKIEVPQELREQIVYLYQKKGYGLEKIKKELKLNWNQTVIKRVLKEEGVQLRTYKEAMAVMDKKMKVPRQVELRIIEAYQKGWGLDKIVKELELPFGFDKVKSILKDNNIHIRNIQEAHAVATVKDLRKYPINDNYCLESHNGAWLIGFLAADGYLPVTKGARNRVVLRLSEKDENVLHLIAKELEFKGPIARYEGRLGENIYNEVSLAFSSKTLREQLENYGVVNNKTFKFNHIPNLPEEYIIDFIAGLFDGDGSIGICHNGRLFWGLTSASKELLKEIELFLHNKYGTPLNKIYPDKNVYVLRFGARQDILKLGEAFYNNNYLRLPRKRNKYLSIRE